MLYLIGIAAGILVGLITGGKIKNLLGFEIRKPVIILMAFVIQSIFAVLAKNRAAFNDYSLIILIVTFLLISLGVWHNRKFKGIIIIWLGFLSNTLVMLPNNGKMPVFLNSAYKPGMIIGARHIAADENTLLGFLGDYIYPPGFLGFFNKIVSIGDIVIVIGLCVVIIEIIKGKGLRQGNNS